MRVPREMCAAPLEFVRAMLCAFLSQALFGRTHGEVVSQPIASRDLADGLVMACARLGVPATLDDCGEGGAARLRISQAQAGPLHKCTSSIETA